MSYIAGVDKGFTSTDPNIFYRNDGWILQDVNFTEMLGVKSN